MRHVEAPQLGASGGDGGEERIVDGALAEVELVERGELGDVDERGAGERAAREIHLGE